MCVCLMTSRVLAIAKLIKEFGIPELYLRMDDIPTTNDAAVINSWLQTYDKHSSFTESIPPQYITRVEDIKIEHNIRISYDTTTSTSYLKINSFNSTNESAIHQRDIISNTLRDHVMRGSKGIVIDLRGNSGGSLRIMFILLSIFTGEGEQIVIRNEYSDKTLITYKDETWEYRHTHNYRDIPADASMVLPTQQSNIIISVIVDSHTASAAEYAACIIDDFPNSIIIGDNTDRTAGCATDVIHLSLSDGSSAVITTGYVVHKGIPVTSIPCKSSANALADAREFIIDTHSKIKAKEEPTSDA